MYMYLVYSFTTEYIFFSFMREREDRKDTERERERYFKRHIKLSERERVFCKTASTNSSPTIRQPCDTPKKVFNICNYMNR